MLIEPGRDQRTHDESFEQKQSGLTIALSGAAGSAVNSAVTTAQSVSDESDDRLAALKIAQGVMSGVSTGQAMALDAVNGSDLTETEKQKIVALSTLAAGLAGGLAGDDTAGIIAGAQSGKNAVENNALGDKDKKLPILDIRPGWLKPGILDENGELSLAGGGIAKVAINKGQQNKHVPGTNEYKIASEAGLNKSTLTVQPDLLLPKLGTGQQVGNTPVGVPGSKERINYGQNIGNYIDPQTGISTPTTNGIVHYGKNGVHIVPARPSDK